MFLIAKDVGQKKDDFTRSETSEWLDEKTDGFLIGH